MIDAINESQAAAKVETKTKIIGKDDFFKMLVAQLKNQDPLNPLDGTEFAAQLAQFSSLEQLTNLNNALAAQSQFYRNLVDLEAASLVGKVVTLESTEGASSGMVSAVHYRDGETYLTVEGKDYPLSSIKSVQ